MEAEASERVPGELVETAVAQARGGIRHEAGFAVLDEEQGVSDGQSLGEVFVI